MNRGLHRTILFATAASAAVFASQSAMAQEEEVSGADMESSSEAGADTTDVTHIVVTGTRIVRNGNDAPTPVSVVTAEEIQKAAPVTIADYVNQLPSLAGSTNPRSHGNSLNRGAGANLLNLRSLGVDRTLTLLNGRRVTPSTLTGAVDVNTIPTALVKRVDVVTGGASASWGSDAVAGVVNFVLDTKYEGVKANVQAGVSEEGDADSRSAELSIGKAFAGDRGHILVSGNYSKSGIARFLNRDWYEGYKIFANPDFAVGNGEPRQLVLPNSSLLINDYGLVTRGPLAGTAFDEQGQVATFNYPFGPVISGVYQSGGPSGDIAAHSISVIPLEQGAVYGRLSFDITDNVTIFGEGSYGESSSSLISGPLRRQAPASVAIDNFYLPESVRTRMVNAGVNSIGVFSNKLNLGLVGAEADRNVLRGLIGLEGTFGSDWLWSASFQSGRAKIFEAQTNNFRPSRYLQSIDAVRDPVTGNPVCRITLTDPTSDCVPINPLGGEPLTAEQRSWFIGEAVRRTKVEQQVAEASIQGSPFSLPAGDVSIAVGGEYRKEKATATADEISQTLGWFVGNFAPFQGKYDVKEAFVETSVPIFRDSAIGRSLTFNGAARITDYSTSGSVTTWKLGGVYEPVDGLQFRVTRSRDIRAPNLNDLFVTRVASTKAVSDPELGGQIFQVLELTGGNPDLDPEIAQSLTVGAVFQPAFLPGFSISVDYFDIKIGDAIATSSSQQILDQCAVGDTKFCGFVTRGANGQITQIEVIPFNAVSQSARGIDFEVGYRAPLGAGTLNVRGLLNYLDKAELVSPDGVVTTVSGEVGTNQGAIQGIPHFRGLATVGYTTDLLDLQLKGRFIGGGKMESDFGPEDVNRNDVPGIFYLDAFVGANVLDDSAKMQVYMSIENLLDKDPPVVVSFDNTNSLSAGTNLSLYDAVGRTFRVGARLEF